MKKIVTSGMRDCTVSLDGSECAVKFGSTYRVFSVQNNSDSDITVSIYEGKTAENDGVRVVKAGESGMLAHMRSDVDTVYVTGSGSVAVAAGNEAVNPFSKGGKGGVTKADLDKITPQLLFSGVTSESAPAVVDLTGYEMVKILIKSATASPTVYWNTSLDYNTSWISDDNVAVGLSKGKSDQFLVYISSRGIYTLSTNDYICIYGINQHTELKIYSQPQDVTAVVGDTATISVGVQGDGLSYQWQGSINEKNWSNQTFSGSNTNKMIMSSVKSSWNGFKYRCIITDKYGNAVTSDVATLTVTESFNIDDTVNEELGG